MEKGWWFGIIAGVLVAFVIFTVGFYSGNVVTGQFFHKYLFGEQVGPLIDQESQEDEDLALDEGTDSDYDFHKTEDLDTDDQEERRVAQVAPQNSPTNPAQSVSPQVQNSLHGITPTRVIGPRTFGSYGGKTIVSGCNLITIDATKLNLVGGNHTGNEICAYYGYNFCVDIAAEDTGAYVDRAYDNAGVVDMFDCSNGIYCSSAENCSEFKIHQLRDPRAVESLGDSIYIGPTISCCNIR